MKFSKQWLQEYIVEILPGDGVVADTLNKKAFEVESTSFFSGDTIFDIKVLPNRAHDALGHRGMARELCSDLGLTFKEDTRISKRDTLFDVGIIAPPVAINDEKSCTRFMSMCIDGIKVGESPAWLKSRLEAIGQRSINNIVDATNYVQFALNKPMHAYDANSIKGTLRARFASKGEVLTTLDDKEIALDEQTLVIADDKKVLGLAGVKGGKHSGINSDTTNIILESANFAPSLIRRTSQKYNLHTDASKRFENGIANSLVEDGLYMTANVIRELCDGAKGSEATDVYPREDKVFKVGISVNEVNCILGANYVTGDIEQTLELLMFPYEKVIPEQKLQELIPVTLNKPYNRLASTLYDGPDEFSCGSLVNWLYKECGYPTPRIALDMYIWSRHIGKEELRFGDLIFTNTKVEQPKNAMIYSKVLGKEIPDVPNYTKTVEFLRGTEFTPGIDHVGMYIGNGKVLHTGSMIEKVITEDIDSSDYFKNECWYGRFVEDLSMPQYVINVPPERLDIRVKEEVVEEIGRILGYDKLVPVLPELSRMGTVDKHLSEANKIRGVLAEKGFSEIMTYAFQENGEIEITNPIASDKKFLRGNLINGLNDSVVSVTMYNAPLLGLKEIKIFEIGTVFKKEGEEIKIAVGESKDLKISPIFSRSRIVEIQGLTGREYTLGDAYKEFVKSESVNPKISENKVIKYKPISQYPFALRDIAVFVPGGTGEDEVKKIIESEAGDLLVRNDLFDKFEKEGKISYAFHLVFQSYEKTLSDIELDEIMGKITQQLNGKTGWQVR